MRTLWFKIMLEFSTVTVTMEGVLAGLYALVAVMIIVVLYHTLFIIVDLRKIMRRFEETTAQIEATLLKPLAIIDEAFQWVMDHLHSRKKKHTSKDNKPFDVEEI